jgi:UDP-N-acetylmuramoyl-tripeptide--D-alanyl-D-alanine ligase
MNKPLKWVAAQLGRTIESDAQVTGWSVDSRTLRPGDLFFALRGPTHDGHAYVAEVLKKGAAAAVVDRDVDVDGLAPAALRVPAALKVRDSLAALQLLASAARREWMGAVVGVTGSAGKTTTKDVIAEMLSEGFNTAKTEGNLNNHVGLPLSLLRIDDQARIAVLEMGMNHAGEIRALAEIAHPDVGVVTNVGWAHIESFDSIEGIAAAKRELIEALPRHGTAVLNADDARVAAFAAVHAGVLPGHVVTFGESERADVRAEDVRFSEDSLAFRVGSTRFESPLTGHHSVSNLLAGIAVAGIYGIPPDRLTDRVRNIQPARMRGERIRHRGILVWNDCYNSNPDALRAMLAVLRDTPARRRIAVLGEMLELGRWAEPLHREVGAYAAECGIDVLVGLRGAACYMLDSAKRSGLSADAAFFFDDPVPAGQLVRSLAQPGDAVLFKGSRGIHVELALEQFLAPSEGGRS